MAVPRQVWWGGMLVLAVFVAREALWPAERASHLPVILSAEMTGRHAQEMLDDGELLEAAHAATVLHVAGRSLTWSGSYSSLHFAYDQMSRAGSILRAVALEDPCLAPTGLVPPAAPGTAPARDLLSHWRLSYLQIYDFGPKNWILQNKMFLERVADPTGRYGRYASYLDRRYASSMGEFAALTADLEAARGRCAGPHPIDERVFWGRR
jgi:hypothetical protein